MGQTPLTPQDEAELEAQQAFETATDPVSKQSQAGAGISALSTGASGNLYIPAPPNTSIAYSGADCRAFLVTYGALSRSSFTPLDNLAAVSYSVHRDKAPVRRLGEYVARDYTKGSRTIAGTIVLVNFDRAGFYELVHGMDIYGAYGKQITMSDEIPPFDIMLIFSEENKGRRSVRFPTNVKDTADTVADFSSMWIRGVRLVDEGSVTGTDEDYLESSFQYVAEEVEYLKPSNEPKVLPVADIIKEFKNTVKDSKIKSEAATPYRLFDPQTSEIVDYDELVGTWPLTLGALTASNFSGSFDYTLIKEDIGSRMKEPNARLWKASTATFSIETANQPFHLANTTEITPDVAKVTLSGTGVYSTSQGNTFDIKYNSLPNDRVTLEPDDGGFRKFTLKDVYVAQADDWVDPDAGQPSWLASFFGADPPDKPPWGNLFEKDVHNIGMTLVEVVTKSEIYDAITQPFDATIGTILMPASEVFWDFRTKWDETNTLTAYYDEFFNSTISLGNRDTFEQWAGNDFEAYKGTALQVHLLETDVLRDETVQVSITLPRASTVYHGSYTWEHADGYTDPVEKTLSFSSEDQNLPFFEAWSDPATYIEAAKDGSFSTLLEVTGASYSDPHDAYGDATIKVMVTPPPLVESIIKTTRPAPGFKQVTETHTIETGSDVPSQTIVLNEFSLGEEDISSVGVLAMGGLLKDSWLDDAIYTDSISQDYSNQKTTITLKGMDIVRHEIGSTKLGPTTNIASATQDGYEFIAQNMYADVAFIGEMDNPDNFIPRVDTSSADFDFSNVPTIFQPDIPPIVSGLTESDLANKILRVVNAREPRTFNESFTQSGIDSALWGVLTNGPYIKIADKPDGFPDGSVKFAQGGNEDKAWAAVSLTSLSPAGQQLLDNWGGTCNQSCLEANLKSFIDINESSDGYYLQFDGWNFSFWNNHKWYSKLAEGKVTIPIGMYFCNAGGSCGNIPPDLQVKINNGEILPEFDESVASVNVLTNATYMGPIPFSIDYDKSSDATFDSLGVDVTLNAVTPIIGYIYSGSWGEVHNFTSSIDPIAAPYDMNASATVELNPSDTDNIAVDIQNIDLVGFHPGVETEVTWEYDYHSLGQKDVEFTYTVVDDTAFETSMTINLGPTKPVDFDICKPSSMTLTEVASGGTIDICNNNIKNESGDDLTVSVPTLNGANWEITISNIPALVLVPAGGFTGFLVNTWNWVLGNPDSTAPTGELEAIVYLKTVDLSTNATAGHTINGENLETLALKLRYDYPATPGTMDTYVGSTEALQISGVSYDPDDPDHFKWTHYYQQPPSNEVRLLLPQGEHGQNTEAFFSDNYSHGSWGDFSIKDVTNYGTVNNQPQLDFEIYNFPAQAEPLTFDLHYQYQLSKMDVGLLYLSELSGVYSDLIVNDFTYKFTATIPTFGLLDADGKVVDTSDPPGKFDVINHVWFVDHAYDEAGCTGTWGLPTNDATTGDVCYWEVDALDEATAANITTLVPGSNQFFYRASDKDLIFPTGLHPKDATLLQEPVVESGQYTAVVDYDQLSDYTPPSQYTKPGYVVTALLNLTNYDAYVFAIDLENNSVNYRTDGSIGTDQTDNSFCAALGGIWQTDPTILDTMQGNLSAAGSCVDATGEEQLYITDAAGVPTGAINNSAQCEGAFYTWIPDQEPLGICGSLDLDDLIYKKKVFFQFSFWLIGPNSTNDLFDVTTDFPSYPDLQTCLSEMNSYYIDNFGVGNLTQQPNP